MAATTPPILNDAEAIQRLKSLERPWAGDYLAMYSSWLGGVTRSPWLMTLPLDDHMVHRGDGIFEATKCIAGRIYQFEAHVDRLARSAAAIRLDLPVSREELTALARATVAAGGQADCMVRFFVSRGPGGFTTNPRECPVAGLYLMASRFHPVPAVKYERGVSLGISRVPAKPGFFAAVKSCNYLPNVLLKMEAVESGWDFSIGLDETGHIAEGSTENVGMVDASGTLVLPPADNILEGTTLLRALALAPQAQKEGVLTGVTHRPITRAELAGARELMLFGTTLDVLPATSLDGRPIGDGQVGPVARRLLELVRGDILDNPASSLATPLAS